MQRKGKAKGKSKGGDDDWGVDTSKSGAKDLLVHGWKLSGTALLAALAIGIIAGALYVNTLGHDFTVDDESAILGYKAIRDHDGPLAPIFTHDFWGTPMDSKDSHKSFRPVTTLSFRLSHYLYQWSLEYWHAENIILHSAVSVSFFAVVHVVSDGDLVLSFMASLLFAAHPIHVEAVASLAHRAEMFCALFFLLAFLAFLASSNAPTTNLPMLALACILYAFSALSKEIGFTLLGVTVVYGFANCLHQRSKMGSFIFQNSALSLTAFSILYWRAQLSGNSVAPVIPWMDNPAGWQPSLFTRCLSYMYQHSVQAGLLVFPLQMRMDYSPTYINVVHSIADIRNLGSAFLYGSMLVYACWAAYGSLVMCYCSTICCIPSLTFCSSLADTHTSRTFAATEFVVACHAIHSSEQSSRCCWLHCS
jgi:hypothetical protein